MLPILVVAIFVVSMGLFMSALYFFVETPIARRKMMTRLGAVQQVAAGADDVPDLLRKELLSDVPFFHRTLSLMPGVLHLRLFLEQGGVRIQLGTFVLIVVSVFLFVFTTGVLLDFPLVYNLLAGVVSAALPFVVVAAWRNRRFNKFEEQFPEAIDLLGRAVRAGHAFTTGFEMIGKELPDPLGEEFRIAYRQQNLGLPLRAALSNMAVRVPLPDVRIFVSSLQIQRESGGNLGEILDTLSTVIRERFKLHRQVKVYTAEGRLSMYTLTGLPIVTVIGLSLFKPDYLRPLFVDPRGHLAIAVVILLQIIGYVVISRLIRIKV